MVNPCHCLLGKQEKIRSLLAQLVGRLAVSPVVADYTDNRTDRRRHKDNDEVDGKPLAL